MFGIIKTTVFLVNMCLMVQVVLSGGNDPADPANPEIINEPSQVLSNLNQEQLLQESHVQPDAHDIQVNKDAFAALQNHFGNVGPLMFDVVTNENALGKEFAKVSRIIGGYVNFEKYRLSLSSIMELAERVDFPKTMTPLFEEIADIRDPKGQQTLGEAVQVLLNISRDATAVDEIRKRITSPNPILKS